MDVKVDNFYDHFLFNSFWYSLVMTACPTFSFLVHQILSHILTPFPFFLFKLLTRIWSILNWINNSILNVDNILVVLKVMPVRPWLSYQQEMYRQLHDSMTCKVILCPYCMPLFKMVSDCADHVFVPPFETTC